MQFPVKLLLAAALSVCAAVLFGEGAAGNAEDKHASVIEGEIGQVSSVNYNSDYPDCYVIAQFKIKNLVSGPATPRTVNLAIPCYMNYKPTKYAALKQGMLIRGEIISREHATEKEIATQQADDLNDFTRETYFLRNGKRIYSYADMPEPEFLDQSHYTSTYGDALNEPQSPSSRKRRAEQIRNDLAAAEAAAAESSIAREALQKKWRERQKSLPQFKPGIYWFQNGTGVFALPKDISPYWDNDVLGQGGTRGAIQSICALDEYLKGKNVDLIVVLYPSIYPLAIRAMFGEAAAIPIRENLDIARDLLKRGVEVIDLAPEMVKLIPKSEFLLYYYHLNNHPGWETQDLAGKLIAQRLERYDLEKTLDPNLFKEKRAPATDLKNYVYPHGVPIAGNTPGEIIKTNCTVYNNAATAGNPSSPVVMWGNSFLNWPKNHALVTAVAKHALMFPEIRNGSGCFTTMLKDLLLNPDFFLRGKRVLIMPVSTEMIAVSQFWNIRELDETLKIGAAASVTGNIGLPPGIGTPEAHRMLRISRGAEAGGTAYMIGKKPLTVSIPGAAGKRAQYIRITLMHNRQLNIRYGRTEKMLMQPGGLIYETVYFPYDLKAGEIVLQSKSSSCALLVKEISLLEVRQ